MELKPKSYVSKVWKDRDIVGYEDANRWETGIADAHNEISSIREVLESLGGTGTSDNVIDDSVEADNPIASTRTWSITKIVEQLSGKVEREELQEVVTEAVQEAVQETVQETIREEMSNLEGFVTKSPTAPENLNSIWLDTQA